MNCRKEIEDAVGHILSAGEQVVLMCGVSGSGKTTFARILEKSGYLRLSVDELIWKRHGKRFADFDDVRRREIFMRCGEEIEMSVMKCIEDGCRIVLDSTMCKRKKRDRLREICGNYGIDPVFIYMKAPYEILRHRLDSRSGEDANDQIVDERLLDDYFAHFECPDDYERHITIVQEE